MRITSSPRKRTISAGTNVTANARLRSARAPQGITAATKAMNRMSPEKRAFTRQIMSNMRHASNVMAATNTSNIAARPDFIELLPLFTQNLLVPEVAGTIAMNSRQQLVPYFKVKTENAKGRTAKGTLLSSPFVNRNGVDPDFTGRVVRDEAVEGSTLQFVPVLPYSVTVTAGAERFVDDGNGNFVDASGNPKDGATVDYATGIVEGLEGDLVATYQYDNETVGPDASGQYGAKFGKVDLQLDEINLIAQAHELASYWSIYSAFAANQEYGANIADLSKEAAFAELTAEINTQAFDVIARAASHKPQFDWDASPVLSGSVVPSDYLNMLKLKLTQAANACYQETRLAQPNKLVVGTTVAAYLSMVNGFQAESHDDAVGPYRAGKLDQFDVYCNPNYDPNLWVMTAKSPDLRRNGILYGTYMPLTATDPLTLGDMSTQQGFCTMYDIKIVNPGTIVSGRILGTF